MNRPELKELVIQVLTEIQTNSGRPVPSDWDDLRPLEDIDGFDSLNAVEAATMLSVRLGVGIHDNPFVQGNEALRLSKVVDRLLIVLQARVGSHA